MRRHRTVIDAFGKDAPIFAVTTQVAEMSLDISADTLISEYAPVWALIQRLGRLNRKDTIPPNLGTAFFYYPPSGELPYEPKLNLLETAKQWVLSLCDGTGKSQADLAEAFLKTMPQEEKNLGPLKNYAWRNNALLFEEIERVSIEESGYTSEVVREEDLPADHLSEVVIPMSNLVDVDMRIWKRERHYFIAPTGYVLYDERRGAEWKNSLR